MNSKINCPKCGSDEVVYIKHHIQWIMTPNKFSGTEFICCNCGEIIEKAGERE